MTSIPTSTVEQRSIQMSDKDAAEIVKTLSLEDALAFTTTRDAKPGRPRVPGDVRMVETVKHYGQDPVTEPHPLGKREADKDPGEPAVNAEYDNRPLVKAARTVLQEEHDAEAKAEKTAKDKEQRLQLEEEARINIDRRAATAEEERIKTLAETEPRLTPSTLPSTTPYPEAVVNPALPVTPYPGETFADGTPISPLTPSDPQGIMTEISRSVAPMATPDPTKPTV